MKVLRNVSVFPLNYKRYKIFISTWCEKLFLKRAHVDAKMRFPASSEITCLNRKERRKQCDGELFYMRINMDTPLSGGHMYEMN